MQYAYEKLLISFVLLFILSTLLNYHVNNCKNIVFRPNRLVNVRFIYLHIRSLTRQACLVN